jgi:hypothetical protein
MRRHLAVAIAFGVSNVALLANGEEPNMELGYGCVLMAYQFAAAGEAHGVPAKRASGH